MKVLVFIALFLIWLYIISVLKRSGAAGWAYYFGLCTTVIFLVIYCRDFCMPIISQITLRICSILGDMTGLYTTYVNYGVICVDTDTQVQMYLDYECAGVFEMFMFAASALFFPLYKNIKKILVLCTGLLWVLFANVLRIIFIASSTSILGSWFYLTAHGFIGRLLIFYPLAVFMWWKLFTKPQIMAQKVGAFTYD